MVDHNWSMNVSNLGGAVSELSLQERLDRLRASCANHDDLVREFAVHSLRA